MPPTSIVVDETTPGVALNWERQYELAGHYSRFYRELSDALAPLLSRRLDLPLAAAAVFAREAVVPLGYFYLDRLLRFDLLLAAEPRTRRAVAKAAPFRWPARVERLQESAGASPALAQVLRVHHAKLWSLEVVDAPPAKPAAMPAPFLFANKNFNRSTFAQKVRRVALIAYRRLTGPRRRVPVLSMGYATDALKNEGFYSTYLENVQGRTRLEDGVPDPAAREALRAHLLEAAKEPLARFLAAASFPRADGLTEDPLGNFADFAVQAFPSSLLEAARTNHDRGVETLRPFQPAPLIIGERGDLESAALIAATKTLGMESIDFQHGGHIGYLVDQSSTLEMEEYICDRFISWGWTRYPDYPPHPAPPLVALPNPWLSERVKYWRRALRDQRGLEKPQDFLLLSNRIHRYPTIPSGAYQLTADYLPAYGETLVALAREANRQRRSLLHKPYSRGTAALMTGTLAAMEKEGGAYYRCLDVPDKGLSPELIAQARVMLWDQPGTGFLECLAAGIPTMCCWSRLYNREEPHAEAAFAELESVGIVHRAPQTLFAEARRLADAGVEAWMSDAGRTRAAASFSRTYGWAKEDWSDDWARFFRG